MRALCLLALLGSAAAQTGKVAEQVIAAVSAGDDAALRKLAARTKPDPWLVVANLRLREEKDAAVAFAKATGDRHLAAFAKNWTPDRALAKRYYEGQKLERERQDRRLLASLADIETLADRDRFYVMSLFELRAFCCQRLRQFFDARDDFARAAELARDLGWQAQAQDDWHRAALNAAYGDDLAASLDYWQRSLAIAEERGDKFGMADALGNLAITRERLGQLLDALATYERCVAIEEEIGYEVGIAKSLGNIGAIHARLGDFRRARDLHEQALARKRDLLKRGTLKDPSGVIISLGNLSTTHRELGDFRRALLLREEAVELAEKHGDLRILGNQLQGLVVTLMRLGLLDRAVTVNARMERVIAGSQSRVWPIQRHITSGALREKAGDARGAAMEFRRAAELAAAAGFEHTRESALVSLAIALGHMGKAAEAVKFAELAVEAAARGGRKERETWAVSILGAMLSDLGETERARAMLQRAVELAREIAAPHHESLATAMLAEFLLEHGEPRAAVELCRQSVRQLERVVGGLGDVESASGKDAWSSAYTVGIRAAAAAHDVVAAVHFLEAGRAGALLEALGGQDRMSAALVPQELRDAERDARAAEIAALRGYGAARIAGKGAKEWREKLAAARRDRLAVIARIQRDAKRQAEVVYPAPASLDAIRATLRPGEACVLYGLVKKGACAVVIRPGSARIVPLGDPDSIREACTNLSGRVATEFPWQDAAGIAKRLLVEPLKLLSSVRRVLVSPHGAAAFVPFSLLLPGREVVHMPSASTWVHLRGRIDKRGRGVLALGDPDYSLRAGKQLSGLDVDLLPLPATRAEARAVGDTVLLGRDANPAELARKLRGGARLRALHFACHARMDRTRPVLSELALSATADTPGRLSCLDIYRMRVPADLVVLSACETGQGKTYEGEGVVGFVRAFMMAGASGVLCSLWKVDDSATSALMRRFYEAWKKGTPAAAALRDAQAHVAAQPKWKHPRYWAAWQLWGLPE